MDHLLRKTRELTQKYRAEKPHPANAQHRAEHHRIGAGELQVAPGFTDRVPVDFQGRVGRWCKRNELRHGAASKRQAYATDGHVMRACARYRHNQPAHDVAQQNGHEGPHFHHAIAARQLMLFQRLRQIGVLDRAEQCGMKPHQESAAEQDDCLDIGVVPVKA